MWGRIFLILRLVISSVLCQQQENYAILKTFVKWFKFLSFLKKLLNVTIESHQKQTIANKSIFFFFLGRLVIFFPLENIPVQCKFQNIYRPYETRG